MSRKRSHSRVMLIGALMIVGAVLAGCGGGGAGSGSGAARQEDYLPGVPGASGPSGLTGPVATAHSDSRGRGGAVHASAPPARVSR